MTRFIVTLLVLILVVSTVMVPFSNSTSAPISARMRLIISTSAIFGRFSITQIPRARIVAGRIATAAFLAPVTSIVPFSGTPPLITIFSVIKLDTSFISQFSQLFLFSILPSRAVFFKQAFHFPPFSLPHPLCIAVFQVKKCSRESSRLRSFLARTFSFSTGTKPRCPCCQGQSPSPTKNRVDCPQTGCRPRSFPTSSQTRWEWRG